MTTMIHPALAHPFMSWLRKRSLRTLKRRKNQRISRKNSSRVQVRLSKG